MARKLADILSNMRRQYFTGREKELLHFRSLLTGEAPGTYLLYLYGPGGQGKTTLVKAFMELCRENQVSSLLLDGRELNPVPHDFLQAVQWQMGATGDVFEALQETGKLVIFIDTYELLNPLDDWLRQHFLPQLPDHVVTVISGRNPPSKNWMADTAWQSLMKPMEVRNLSLIESRNYLEKRNVATTDIDKILDFTHGHPLALSVVADMYLQNPGKHFNPGDHPDMVRTLLENFVQKVPGPAHRTALEICAMVHTTTESLLQQVLEVEDASELFLWLQELSFTDNNRSGIFPHDLARDAVCADLQWRNPDWNHTLHDRIRKYYTAKLELSTGNEQRQLLFYLNFLHRQHPMVRPFFDWQETGTYWIDGFKPDDEAAIVAITKQHEGTAAADAMAYWIKHTAAQTWVFRNIEKEPAGFVLRINIDEIPKTENANDPNIEAVRKYAEKNLGLRKGDICTLFRFWMAGDTYQGVSGLQSSIFLAIVQYYISTPGLAITMLQCTLPEFWKQVLNYADLTHLPDLNFTIENEALGGTVPAGWYMHDWRKTPPASWLNMMGQRETGEQPELINEQQKVQVLVLSEDEFASCVYDSLKDYQNDKKLAQNPLLRSRVIIQAAENESDTTILIATLRDCLADATDKIKETPKQDKLHRVLFRTFFNPAGSQEQVADYLNIPFSTYRRYLRKGVAMVTENLWQLETGR
jgi:hypothetical protein